MIQLTYQELYLINPLEARKILLSTFEQTGDNFLRTAKELGCSRNTVKKFVRRQKMGLPLEDLSRRPRHSPCQTAKEVEELVVKERKLTNFGRLRLAYHIRKEHDLQVSSFTIRNILRRHRLTKPRKRRGKFRSISYYDWDKIYPLQHFQIDLKVIRDQKSLPWATYQHIQKYRLPPYQWTAIDPYTKTKFLAYSYEKSFSNGLTFMLLIHLWLRSFGIAHQLFFQTDWGEEFGGKSPAKLSRLQTHTFDPLKVQLLRIRKRQWKDNAYVERTHRTDDEEFYVPTLQSITGLEEHFTQALKYLYTFNCLRPHFGKPMPGKTPSERVQVLYPGLTKHFYLFPPLVLDYISAQEPFIGGHDLLAYYYLLYNSLSPLGNLWRPKRRKRHRYPIAL
jgi:transposase